MGETIQLKAADGFSFSAYVAGPANATKGVVVVQEIFGVNHHIRDMADRFAALGYAVVAPNARRQLERRQRFEQREERTAEQPGLLAGDDGDGVRVREQSTHLHRARRWHSGGRSAGGFKDGAAHPAKQEVAGISLAALRTNHGCSPNPV